MESRGSWPCKEEAHHLYPSWVTYINLSYIAILNFHLHVYTSSTRSFSFRFTCQSSTCTSVLHHMWNIHHPISGLITIRVFTERVHKSWNHLLCNFPHPPVTSSLLATNVFLNGTWLKQCLLHKIIYNPYMFQCFTPTYEVWLHILKQMIFYKHISHMQINNKINLEFNISHSIYIGFAGITG